MLITEKELQIWSGVFDSFAATGIEEDVFLSDFYVSKVVAHLENALAAQTFEQGEAARDYILNAVLATLACDSDTLRVLDFGGGVGTAYLSARRALDPSITLKFDVIDNDQITSRARALFGADEGVRFRSDIGAVQDYDVCHCGSSAQYVEDPGFLFAHAVECGVRHFVVSDFPCGDNPTFVTKQHHYGKELPIKFWNVDEFCAIASTYGFRKTLYQPFRGAYLKPEQEISMTNFPAENRIANYKQLLFTRSDRG